MRSKFEPLLSSRSPTRIMKERDCMSSTSDVGLGDRLEHGCLKMRDEDDDQYGQNDCPASCFVVVAVDWH